MRGSNRGQTKAARRLRQDATLAERRLRSRLRSRGLSGMKFIRQEPVGPHIVDFACRELRLIEVDGGQHAESELDAVHDRWLRDLGYGVLGFWNHDVIREFESVLLMIARAPEARLMAEQMGIQDGASSPAPRLPGEGRGEGP